MASSVNAAPMRIGMLWHSSNSGNLGVGALTVANLAIVREVAAELGLKPEFTIIGMRDRERRYLAEGEARDFGVNTRALLDPAGLWAEIGRQDLLLDIGGGDSFADIYGAKRFAYLWLSKMFAFGQRKPLLLSPQTIGPFTRFPYTSLAQIALNSAASVVARDDVSFGFLERFAPKARAVLSADVAFALPYQDRSAERGGTKVRVGVNISGLLLDEAQSSNNRFGLDVDYAVLTERLLQELTSQPDVEVHLITHVVASTAGRDDDAWAVDEFHRKFPSAIRVPNFASPSAAKSYISSLDFLVAARMHACIAAISSGTPVVPIAYSRKFSGLFGMLAYPWTLPVRGMSTDQALDHLRTCFGKRAQLATDASRAQAAAAGLLSAYRAELRSVLQSVSQTP